MRIQARAYSSAAKKMIYFSEITVGIDIGNSVSLHAKGGLCEHAPDSPLMVFTGHEAKDGNKVWESDIVLIDRQDSFSSWNKGIVSYNTPLAAFVIIYLKEPSPLMERLFSFLSDWPIVSVLGNLFENSDWST